MPTTGQPIVIAHHIMWTLYGWWLPNDPRGSTSRVIRQDVLAELGELHFGRKHVQPPRSEVRGFYEEAVDVLKHPLLKFNPDELCIVGAALGSAIAEYGYTCYAAAVMPDHVHLMMRKHRDLAEEMIQKIQSLSRKRLKEAGLRPTDHPTWTRGGWKVFLEHPQEVWRTIKYIHNNPLKIGLPAQTWPFVKSYDNWPLHPGHSENSPYVKALRAAGRYP